MNGEDRRKGPERRKGNITNLFEERERRKEPEQTLKCNKMLGNNTIVFGNITGNITINNKEETTDVFFCVTQKPDHLLDDSPPCDTAKLSISQSLKKLYNTVVDRVKIKDSNLA